MTIASRYHLAAFVFFPALGIADRARFHFTAAAKTIRQKKRGKEEKETDLRERSIRMPESNDECAFIGPHLSRVALACTSDVGEDRDGNGSGRKKYGSAGGREMGGENGQERESRGR